jgi:hypothetical protein
VEADDRARHVPEARARAGRRRSDGAAPLPERLLGKHWDAAVCAAGFMGSLEAWPAHRDRATSSGLGGSTSRTRALPWFVLGAAAGHRRLVRLSTTRRSPTSWSSRHGRPLRRVRALHRPRGAPRPAAVADGRPPRAARLDGDGVGRRAPPACPAAAAADEHEDPELHYEAPSTWK